MMKVFVLDKDHKPLMPCGPARARKLLKAGRARVHKLQPFTIRIVDRSLADSVVQKVVVKVDPASRSFGRMRKKRITRSTSSISSTAEPRSETP